MRKAGAASRLTTLIVVSIVAATFIAGIIARAQRDEHGPIDLIVLNGKVYAGDGKTFAEAVAVQGNKIVVVGSNRDIKRLRRPQTTVIDAHGGSVLPGFNDSYVHFVKGSATRHALDLADATTVADVTSRLQEYADQHKDAEWIVAKSWEPASLGTSALTRDALDKAISNRPVYVTSADGRMAWVNSTALARAGITRATASAQPGAIVRNKKGDPTGVLRESAIDLVRKAMTPPEPEEQIESLRAGIADAHRLGITSVQNAAGDVNDLTAFDELRAAGELKLRVYQSLGVAATATETDLSKLEDTRKQYGDDPLLKTGAVEVTADGGTRDGLMRLVTALDRRGWQIWIRAQSTQAVQWALDALQAATEANPSPPGIRRHRIEQAETIAAGDAERFAKLGVIVSAPSSPVAEELAAANTRIALGSDWPAAPLDPRAALRDAVAPLGEGPEPTAPRALSLRSVLDAYTSGSAYASFDDQRKGTLAPGMLADIVVLSADIFATPLDRMLDASVDVTIFDGAVVYTRAD